MPAASSPSAKISTRCSSTTGAEHERPPGGHGRGAGVRDEHARDAEQRHREHVRHGQRADLLVAAAEHEADERAAATRRRRQRAPRPSTPATPSAARSASRPARGSSISGTVVVANAATPPSVESTAKRPASSPSSSALASRTSWFWTSASSRNAAIAMPGAAAGRGAGGRRLARRQLRDGERRPAGDDDRDRAADRPGDGRERDADRQPHRRLGEQAADRARAPAEPVQAPAVEREQRRGRRRGRGGEQQQRRQVEQARRAGSPARRARRRRWRRPSARAGAHGRPARVTARCRRSGCRPGRGSAGTARGTRPARRTRRARAAARRRARTAGCRRRRRPGRRRRRAARPPAARPGRPTRAASAADAPRVVGATARRAVVYVVVGVRSSNPLLRSQGQAFDVGCLLRAPAREQHAQQPEAVLGGGTLAARPRPPGRAGVERAEHRAGERLRRGVGRHGRLVEAAREAARASARARRPARGRRRRPRPRARGSAGRSRAARRVMPSRAARRSVGGAPISASPPSRAATSAASSASPSTCHGSSRTGDPGVDDRLQAGGELLAERPVARPDG